MHHLSWFQKTVFFTGFLMLGACTNMAPPVTPSLVLGPYQIVVQSGDTLYGIASRYGVSLKQLMTLNRLNSSHIQVGQVLLLPQKNEKPVIRETEPDLSPVTPLEPLGPPPYTPLNDEGVASIDPSVAQEIAEEEKLSIAPLPPLAGGAAAVVGGAAGTGAAAANALSSGAGSVASSARSGLAWPVKGDVVAQFSKTAGKRFDGIEIAGTKGDPVKAAQAGTVMICQKNFQSLGNVVIVKGSEGSLTAYGYLAEIGVEKGQAISQGAVVGTLGKSGKVYFEYRKALKAGGAVQPVDPVPLLGGAG